MTLIKSLLLGSAAGVVAVSAAQAADLPTHKGPVAAEYVRVCSITVAGAPVVGFVLPGSDTCFKISGYLTGQIEGGNIRQQYSENYVQGGTQFTRTGATAIAAGATNGVSSTISTVGPASTLVLNPGTAGAAVPANTYYDRRLSYVGQQNIVANSTNGRDSFGYTTRLNLTLDAVSNTAYGPLVFHGDIQSEYGTGFDNTGANSTYINHAYVTWAGLTAGRANSFFSFTGGGPGWANFFSPDRQGFNEPDVLAYTASFGGGFAASISIEDPQAAGNGAGALGTAPTFLNQSGSNEGFLGSATVNGLRVPDIVGSVSVTQTWGKAQVSGVAHNVRGASTSDASTIDTWGFAIDAGVQFNIPNLPGSNIGVTGAWSRRATWYSGIGDGMWDGTANDNGQPIVFADSFYNGGGTWATPTAWSVTGYAQFTVNPTITVALEGSYGQINWTNLAALSPVSNEKAWLVGGVAHYDPVKNLDFEFELLYEKTTTSQPSGYVPGDGVNTTANWQGNSDGFAARFEVTRNF